MRLGTFVAITAFIFLAIVGGLIGIVLEGRRIPAGSGAHNPATHDTVFPIVGWASLFALYLALELVRDEDMTPEFKTLLGTLAVLPFFYAALATAWLIWRSARRIHASLTGGLPVAWRTIPYLARCAFRSCSSPRSCRRRSNSRAAAFSLSDALLASVVVLLALLQKPRSAQ